MDSSFNASNSLILNCLPCDFDIDLYRSYKVFSIPSGLYSTRYEFVMVRERIGSVCSGRYFLYNVMHNPLLKPTKSIDNRLFYIPVVFAHTNVL